MPPMGHFRSHHTHRYNVRVCVPVCWRHGRRKEAEEEDGKNKNRWTRKGINEEPNKRKIVCIVLTWAVMRTLIGSNSRKILNFVRTRNLLTISEPIDSVGELQLNPWPIYSFANLNANNFIVCMRHGLEANIGNTIGRERHSMMDNDWSEQWPQPRSQSLIFIVRRCWPVHSQSAGPKNAHNSRERKSYRIHESGRRMTISFALMWMGWFSSVLLLWFPVISETVTLVSAPITKHYCVAISFIRSRAKIDHNTLRDR